VFKLRAGLVLDPPLQPKPMYEGEMDILSGAQSLASALPEAERLRVEAAWDWWSNVCGSPTSVLAPMVAQSDKCFRLLCRQENVGLCFSPMYLAERVNSGVHDDELEIPGTDTTHAPSASAIADRPLVCQLAGNSIEAVIQAGMRVQGVVDAVDNCYIYVIYVYMYYMYYIVAQQFSLTVLIKDSIHTRYRNFR
jgi:hypothetical protein